MSYTVIAVYDIADVAAPDKRRPETRTLANCDEIDWGYTGELYWENSGVVTG